MGMTEEEMLDVISRAEYIDKKCINVESKRKGIMEWELDSIPLWNFNNYEYRIIEEPEMIPLDFSDILDIINKWLVDTRDNTDCYITSIDTSCQLFISYGNNNNGFVSFQDLQKHFIFKDTGKRLEKEKK